MNEQLCVFIPTYKRTEGLRQAITSVIESSVAANVDDIAIYVSNNVWNDKEAQNVISELKRKWAYIFYEENAKNLGIDSNMRKGYSIAGAKFCLMLGDDDRIRRDAVGVLLDYIKKYDEAQFFVLNWSYIDQNGNQKKVVDCEDRIYTNPKEFYIDRHDGMPYGTISCNLEKVGKVSVRSIDKYEGTFHLYAGILMEMIANCCNVVFIGKPLIIKNNCIEKAWTETRAEVLLIGMPLWFDLLPDIYRKEARQHKQEHLNKTKSFRNLLSILGGYNLREWGTFRNAPLPGYMKFKIWSVLLLYSIVPQVFFHNVNKVIKSFARIIA